MGGTFVIQSVSHVWLFGTPWTAACQALLSFTISWSLLKLMPIESVMLSNHLILYRPLLFLPSIFLSIGVFSNESALHIRWPKYWGFSLSISPSSEYSGLTDWLVWSPCCLKSLLQSHNSIASILQHLNLLNSSTLTSVHDYWKNHSFDWTDLCWKSNVSAF